MLEGQEEYAVNPEYIAPPKTFDLREIALAILGGWKVVAAAIGVFLLLTAINLHNAPSVFAIKMVVTPVQGSGGQASSRSASLSSLAELAGLNLGPSAGQSASQFRYYLDSLHSRSLADDLAKNKELMKYIFAREWDARSQTWRKPKSGLVETIMGGINWIIGARPLPWTPPDGAWLQDYLTGVLMIQEDIRRPDHATIEVDSDDPQFAVKLMNDVNWTANEHLRKRALRRATQYIDYLSTELSTVTVAEHREAIMQALSEQEKFKMSAGSGAPYAADLVDGPSVSRNRLSPRPTAAYPTAILKGFLVGAMIVLLLHFFGAPIRENIRNRFPVERWPLFLQHSLGL